VNIVALCDVDTGRLESAAKNHAGAKTYQDFRKLLEQKDIDAVIVATPDNTHAVIAMPAMQLGKHVYCEKPLTHDIWEARQMTEAARKYKVATQMGNHGHASDGLRAQVEWIQAGVIGPVKEVHVWTNRPIWPQGVERPEGSDPIPPTLNWDLWLGPAPERPYKGDRKYEPFNWRGWWDFGTGAIGDMACHTANMAFMALKLGHPTKITGDAGGVNDETCPAHAYCTMQFPEYSTLVMIQEDRTGQRDRQTVFMEQHRTSLDSQDQRKTPKNSAPPSETARYPPEYSHAPRERALARRNTRTGSASRPPRTVQSAMSYAGSFFFTAAFFRRT